MSCFYNYFNIIYIFLHLPKENKSRNIVEEDDVHKGLKEDKELELKSDDLDLGRGDEGVNGGGGSGDGTIAEEEGRGGKEGVQDGLHKILEDDIASSAAAVDVPHESTPFPNQENTIKGNKKEQDKLIISPSRKNSIPKVEPSRKASFSKVEPSRKNSFPKVEPVRGDRPPSARGQTPPIPTRTRTPPVGTLSAHTIKMNKKTEMDEKNKFEVSRKLEAKQEADEKILDEKNKEEELKMKEKMRILDEKLKKVELAEKLYEEKERVSFLSYM